MFLGEPGIGCFTTSPIYFLDASSADNLLPGLIPEQFCEFYIFPGESSSLHSSTKIRCFYLDLFLNIINVKLTW